MDTTRLDTLARTLDAASRRRLLGILTGAGVAFGPLAHLAEARNGKKRGNKKRKKKSQSRCPEPPICPPPPPPPTCAEACAGNCVFCFNRPGGAPALCGSGSTTNCDSSCSSDTDCLGVGNRPYCMTQIVDRFTGQASDLCAAPGGFCSAVDACA